MERLDRRIELFSSLLNSERWNLVINVDSLPDEILHIAYNWKSTLRELYARLDELLGTIVRKTSKEDNVLVVSDHGFQDISRKFYLAEWMRRSGFIRADSYYVARLKRIRGFRRFAPLVKWFLERRNLVRLHRHDPSTLVETKRANTVHLERTTGDHAWISIDNHGANVDLIQTVRRKLMQLVELGYIKAVYSLQELYQGERINDLDYQLLVESADGVHLDVKKITYNMLEHKYPKKGGGHRRNGLLIIWSHNYNCRLKAEQSIYDILPTMLRLMKLPLPNDLEGSPVAFS